MRNRWKAARILLSVLVLLIFTATFVLPVPALAEATRPASPLECSWIWNELYGLYGGAIDAYNEANYMELTELTDMGIPFIAASEYEELNKEHLDGRFEGNLQYSGYAAFVEQAGPLIDFGSEYTREWVEYPSRK